MPSSGATGAIARCKSTSTACARTCRSVHAWRWICGVKPKPKAVNTRSPHSIRHGLDKPGVFTTVSKHLILNDFFQGCRSSSDPRRKPVKITCYCPFAIEDFLKLNFRGMLCILRCECIFAHEVKLLSSSRYPRAYARGTC